jgi:hypothetical protein
MMISSYLQKKTASDFFSLLSHHLVSYEWMYQESFEFHYNKFNEILFEHIFIFFFFSFRFLSCNGISLSLLNLLHWLCNFEITLEWHNKFHSQNWNWSYLIHFFSLLSLVSRS